MVHPFFNPAQAAAFNVLITKTDSTFEIRYFHVHGQGGIARTLIVIGTGGHSRLTNRLARIQTHHTFGVMPLLTETSSDGKIKLQIAESDSIERYLARRFGLFGNGSAFEEVLVNTFANNTQALIIEIFNKVALVEDAEVKAANKGPLITDHIIRWIKHHDEHLQANGANGHYVGDKFTLADEYVISMILGVSGEELVSESKTPAIWRAREEMDKVEGIAVGKASEEYKSLDKENVEFLAY
ncbi:MAG: hypothetical protein J3R72DRAFT_422412 [Linnemannia gamsii]|nr:MAG: hypothetical protein J3R72DRAFT_422412 [Linnemannia gamsii]